MIKINRNVIGAPVSFGSLAFQPATALFGDDHHVVGNLQIAIGNHDRELNARGLFRLCLLLTRRPVGLHDQSKAQFGFGGQPARLQAGKTSCDERHFSVTGVASDCAKKLANLVFVFVAGHLWRSD
jgi:hypothetical protein